MALVATASLLLVTACGSTGASSGDAAPLSSIKITPGSDDTSDPTVTFDTPLVATETAAQVIVKGKGDDIKENQNVMFKSAVYSSEDASLLGSNFSGENNPLPMTEQLKTELPALYETLLQSKVGSWVAMVEPGAEGVTAEGTSPSEEPASSQAVVVLKVVSTEEIPPAAEPSKKLGDDEVKKLKDDGALPTAEMKDGKPAITIPKDKEPPAGLVVDVVKEGTGKASTETNAASVDYAGVTWSDGKQFDSSYDSGEPILVNLGKSTEGMNVIPGWTQGLVGLKAGTQAILSIPADLAYGADAASQGRPAGTLVFFVELKEVK